MSGVQRFKTFEETERAEWCFDPDDSYIQRVAELWKFAERILSIKYPRGIFRYSTLEEANNEAQQWIVANASFRYRLKKNSVRPKDQNDALFLKGKIEYLKKKRE